MGGFRPSFKRYSPLQKRIDARGAAWYHKPLFSLGDMMALLTLDALDGTYAVTSVTESADPHAVAGEGRTEIKNGMTYRKDAQGLIWESQFTIISETEVEMESTVDPSHSGAGTFIRDEKGNPTKGMMTYRTSLAVSHDNGALTLTGTVRHAGQATLVTLRKL
jgi:hypothetical protein